MSTKETCKQCDHFHRYNPDYPSGECRKNAPVILVNDGDTSTEFPNVVERLWCGEWKLKIELREKVDKRTPQQIKDIIEENIDLQGMIISRGTFHKLLAIADIRGGDASDQITYLVDNFKGE